MKEIALANTSDIELKILASMLSSPEGIRLAQEQLHDWDFSDVRNRLIFLEISKLSSQTEVVNAEALIILARQDDRLSRMGGAPYIMALERAYDPSIDLVWYISTLRQHGLKRAVCLIAHEMLTKASDSRQDASLIIKDTSTQLCQLALNKAHSIASGAHLMNVFSETGAIEQHYIEIYNRVQRGERPFEGFSSGYPQLDEIICGFLRGTLTMIGARTSMGKTTLMCNLISNLIQYNEDAKIGIFSLEMSAKSLITKFLCMEAGLSYKKLHQGRETSRAYDRMDEIAKQMRPMHERSLFQDASCSLAELTARAKSLVANHGVNILFIDYLTRIKPDHREASKHNEVDRISKGLQTLALDLHIPVICLAQLNRQLTMRPDKTPKLSDFRESGSIEEDADVCLLLHRPHFYDSSKEDVTELYVAKNRLMGDLGKVTYEYSNGKLIERPKIEELMANQIYTEKDNNTLVNGRYGYGD